MVRRGFMFLSGCGRPSRRGFPVAQRCGGWLDLFEPQFVLLVEQLYGAVEQPAHRDSLAWPRQRIVAFEYLVEAVIASYGPVVGDHSALLELHLPPPLLRAHQQMSFLHTHLLFSRRSVYLTAHSQGEDISIEFTRGHYQRVLTRLVTEACALLGNADILGNREGSRELFTPGIWLGS